MSHSLGPPSPEGGALLHPPPPRGDAWRLTVMSVLAIGAGALLLFQEGYRHLEAVLASVIFSGGGVVTFTGTDSVVIFQIGEGRAFGLDVTPECTSAFLIVPFAVIGAAMLLRRRLDPGRVLLGVVVAAVLLILANQLRLGVIAGLVTRFGLDQGYQWGHLVAGSLISIAFIGGAAVVLLCIVLPGRRGGHEVTS